MDPLGLDIVVLNDSDAVNYPGGPYGHNAVLVGNDEDGWVYYSKDGKKDEVRGTEIGDTGNDRTTNGNTRIPYNTYEQFDNETDVSGRYDRRARIDTTSEQDEAMEQKADEVYDNEYDFIDNNCADLVEDALSAGDVDSQDSDVLVGYAGPAPVYSTVPNIQYDNVLNEADMVIEDGVVIKDDSNDSCTE